MNVIFDIGGTNTRVGVSKRGRDIDDLVIYKTPWTYKEGRDKLIASARALAKGERITGVAGGLAGILSLDGKKIYDSPNLPQWNRKPIHEDLEKAFRCEVQIANDADLAGLGEAHFGAGRGFKIVAYLTISTGIGGCRITNGKLDPSYLGFEPGFQIPEMNFNNLAPGIHNAIVFWSPEVVVLGGGRMKDPKIKISQIKRQLKKTLAFYPKLPQIRRAKLGDLGGLLGALEISSIAEGAKRKHNQKQAQA